jgi:Bacterial regulatory proteins, tetR family
MVPGARRRREGPVLRVVRGGPQALTSGRPHRGSFSGAAGTGVTSVLPPARRTRPPNRRELILAAATELFAARGYEYAGMSEIAEQVAAHASRSTRR